MIISEVGDRFFIDVYDGSGVGRFGKEARLELVPKPYYDTQMCIGGSLSFFQNPAGRSRGYTNLETAGSLSWPKRMWVTGFILQFDQSVEPGGMYLDFRIGESSAHSVPVASMTPVDMAGQKERKWEWDIPFAKEVRKQHVPLGLYIPPQHNFRVTLECASWYPVPAAEVRLMLQGTFVQEVT